MAKYLVKKGFRASKDVPTRKKGTIIELSGDELKFAKSNKCVESVDDK